MPVRSDFHFPDRPATHPSEAEELPLDRAYFWEKTDPQRPFLTQPLDGDLRHWNWQQTMSETRRMTAYLRAQNWPPESRIVILSRNCAWWIMAELAIWMAGHVTVPIYTSLTIEGAARLFDHCQPVACFVGALDNPALVEAIGASVLMIRYPSAYSARGVRWEEVIDITEPHAINEHRGVDDLATIVYTSGTTGAPKGVMHRFLAFPYFAKAVEQVMGPRNDQEAFSYLPLAHIAERALTETASIYRGWHVTFCESAATFARDIQTSRPTVFFSVPRLYAKFQTGVFEHIPAEKLAHELKIPVIGDVVRHKILHNLGLDRVRIAASGSAPIAPDLVAWYRNLKFPITEGYGTTESGITHTAANGEFRAGSVGKDAPGVETRISEEGEIQVRSPMNMLGYFRDPELTREAMTEDGFIRSGDLGEIDADGWLSIKGRIKEQFKTSKGKYVSPSAIEMMLLRHPAIETCIVMGSGMIAPVAVAVLSAQALNEAKTNEGRARVEHSLGELIHKMNANLAPHERLGWIAMTNARWTIDNGMLTPTLKLRRSIVEKRYEPLLETWCAEKKQVVWKIDE